MKTAPPLARSIHLGWRLIPVINALLLASASVTLPEADLGIRRFQTPPLSPDMNLGQTFGMTADGLDAIKVFPVAVGSHVSGDVRFELYEVHEVGRDRRVTRLRVLEVPAEDLVRAPSYIFEFPAIADSKDRTYRFDLVASPAEGVAFWATKGRRYARGNLYANGRERWADLAFRVYAPAPTVWGRLMTLRETHPARAYTVIGAFVVIWLLLGFALRTLTTLTPAAGRAGSPHAAYAPPVGGLTRRR